MDDSSVKPVVRLANSDEVGNEIVRALGLPPYVTSLTLVFKAGQPVEVTATLMVEEAPGDEAATRFIEQTAGYRLQRVSLADAVADEVDSSDGVVAGVPAGGC